MGELKNIIDVKHNNLAIKTQRHKGITKINKLLN